uniref:At1g61320/AtMIF1 LRR domain-containing protein n=1 Tax=Quercus lobata TaxID=97700 RepID=A0A7N2MDR7_QUELO
MHAKPAYYPAGGGPFHTDYTRHLFIIDETVMASMLSTCTLLEGLTLDACNVVSNLIVTGPPSLRLKMLKVRYCSTKKIEISAANLIAFDFSGDITRISSFSAPRLLKVRFNTGERNTPKHTIIQESQRIEHECLELKLWLRGG